MLYIIECVSLQKDMFIVERRKLDIADTQLPYWLYWCVCNPYRRQLSVAMPTKVTSVSDLGEPPLYLSQSFSFLYSMHVTSTTNLSEGHQLYPKCILC